MSGASVWSYGFSGDDGSLHIVHACQSSQVPQDIDEPYRADKYSHRVIEGNGYQLHFCRCYGCQSSTIIEVSLEAIAYYRAAMGPRGRSILEGKG